MIDQFELDTLNGLNRFYVNDTDSTIGARTLSTAWYLQKEFTSLWSISHEAELLKSKGEN